MLTSLLLNNLFLDYLLDNSNLLNNSDTHSPILICLEIKDFLANIAERMLQEYQNCYDLTAEVLKGFLKIFVIYLNRQTEGDCCSLLTSRKAELAKLFY